LIMDTRVYQTSLGEFFQSGKFLKEIFLYHLWFLYYLILIYGCVLMLRWFAMGVQLLQPLRSFASRVLSHRFGLLWLTIGTTVCMWPMVLWQVDTPYSIIPNPVLVCYYLLFFVVGMVLYHNQDILNMIKKQSLRYLLVGLLVLPIALFFQSFGPNPAGIPARESWKLPALLSYSVLTWSAVFGLTGWFARHFTLPNRTIRRVSETAYWQYLIHLPVMFAFQLYLVTIDLGSVAEILIQLFAVSLLLYYSYVWVVGRTFIGKFLNGRRIQDLDV
jgi:glucan biosynthesis protein C